MAKTTIRGFRGVFKKIERVFEDVIEEQDFLEFLSFIIVQRIRLLARDGRKMNRLKGTSALPELSDFTKLVKRGILHITPDGTIKHGPDPRPRHSQFSKTGQRSNLTFTGDFLENIQIDIDPSNGKILLAFSKNKHKYSKETHAQIYENLLGIDKGYEILQLDKKTFNEIKKEVKSELKRQIKRHGFAK